MTTNPIFRLKLTLILALSVAVADVAAQPASFTYQGRLNASGAPANGRFDIRFLLYDGATNGQMLHIEEELDTTVTNGLFQVYLNPAESLIGPTPLWLELAVKPAGNPGADFVPLAPRQPLTYVPLSVYARRAESVTDNSVTTATLADGAVTGDKLAPGLVGTGLTLQNQAIYLAFADNGAATTVARGDHQHFGQRWEGAVLFGEGGLEVVNTNNSSGNGLYGQSGANGAGVKGVGGSRGVHGFSSGGLGVSGETFTGTGIYGSNENSDTTGHAGYFNGRVRVTKSLMADTGLSGSSVASFGVSGTTTGNGTGVYGSNGNNETNGHAGYFNGRVRVTKSLTLDGALNANGGVNTTGNNPLELSAGGQRLLRLEPDAVSTNGAPNVIAGSPANYIRPGVIGSTIGGGGATNEGDYYDLYYSPKPNQVEANYSVVGGGVGNFIGGAGNFSEGTFQTAAATISGGYQNTILSNAWGATIGGGSANTVSHGAISSTIGGGDRNYIHFDSIGSTIPGGFRNEIANNCPYSFAAGRRARVITPGSFVWADSLDEDFYNTATNQFAVRAGGGTRLYSRGNSDTLTLLSFANLGTWLNVRNISTGGKTWSLISSGEGNGEGAGKLLIFDGNATRMQLDSAGTLTVATLNQTSDRHAKERIAPVDGREILEKLATIPISKWSLKQDTNTRHIGPMAQDFHAAFEVGTDDKHIATVDADGVALAAIQGLNQKVEEQAAALKAKAAEVDELKQRLAVLERLMNATR